MLRILCHSSSGDGQCVCEEHNCRYPLKPQLLLLITDKGFDYSCKHLGFHGKRADCTALLEGKGSPLVLVVELKSIRKLKSYAGKGNFIQFLIRDIVEKAKNSLDCASRLLGAQQAAEQIVVVALPTTRLDRAARGVFQRFLARLLTALKNELCGYARAVVVYDCEHMFEYERVKC